MGSTPFFTGAGNVLGEVGNDISGFFTGPPGDPGRIRQIANQVDAVHAEFTRAALALDDAVLTLTQSWTGTAATSFSNAWCSCTKDSPSTVLSALADTLGKFSRELRDYADTLEHSQHEHWVQLGVMAALTIVNVAQLGADPVTDAAEVGVGAGMEIAADLSLSGLGDLALSGAMAGFEFDTISQLGADLLDHTDPQFNQTGDDAVPLFDPQEAAQSALYGALYELGDGLGGGLGEGDPLSSLTDDGGKPGADPPADPQGPDDTPGSPPADPNPTPGTVDETAKKFSGSERDIADLLASEGHNVEAVPESTISGQRMYDSLVDGQPTEFKSLDPPKDNRSASDVTVRNALGSANGQFKTITPDQTANAVVDGRGSGLTEAQADSGLQRWLGTGRNRMDTIRIIGDGWEITWP
jgi:uncharacterized protein YukE